MKRIGLFLLPLLFGMVGCKKNVAATEDVTESKEVDSQALVVDSVADSLLVTEVLDAEEEEQEQVHIPLAKELDLYPSVVDSLLAVEDVNWRHSTYSLYDLTGDGIPELFIKSGTCEADMLLYVFSNRNGFVRKIIKTNGNHTDCYVSNKVLVCITCFTGCGTISVFRNFKGKFKKEEGMFSLLNEEGIADFEDGTPQSIVDIWKAIEENDTYKPLEFNPLKP